MVLGPTPATLPSSPATSMQGFKATALRLFVAGKRGGMSGSEAAQKGKQKGVRNRERIQFQPRLPRLACFPCSIPFHFHLVIAGPLCLLVSSTCSVSQSRPAAAAEAAGGGQEGIAAWRRMSDRELHQLRSIRITGDGRCLFRSVAYGACLRRGKQSPSDSIQKELADDLRAKVADEFVKRRGDTEWFLEGDFERMPITVYMQANSSDSPRIIAEYGQEYGKDNPIRVLYDGYGHYDALQPSLVRTQSRLRVV